MGHSVDTSRLQGRLLMPVNPVAGRGEGRAYRDAMLRFKADGGFPKGIEFHHFETVPDRAARGDQLRREIALFDPTWVLGSGGDGTQAEIGEALYQMGGRPPYHIAAPVGTAFDIARCSGVPTKVHRFFPYLAAGRESPLPLAHIRFNGDGPVLPLIHSLIFGLGGEIFVDIEERKKSPAGFRSYQYVGMVLSHLRRTPSYDLAVNGGEPMPSGNTLVSILPRIAGFAGVALPLPLHGAGSVTVPVYDSLRAVPGVGGFLRVTPALIAFGEGLIRGLRMALGDTRFIVNQPPIWTLAAKHQVQCRSGETIHLEVFEPETRNAMGVLAALDGEPVPGLGPMQSADITLSPPVLRTLVAPGSMFDKRARLMAAGAAATASGTTG